MTIKRYDIGREYAHSVGAPAITAQPEGGYVRYEDHAASMDEIRAEKAGLSKLIQELGKIVHDMVVAEQAAWIEWRHGNGAEAAMVWIHNGLAGPGHIPDEDAAYGKDAQAWFDANRADPFPTCFCGRPSNSLWMGQGFCSDAHYREARDGACTQQGGQQ